MILLFLTSCHTWLTGLFMAFAEMCIARYCFSMHCFTQVWSLFLSDGNTILSIPVSSLCSSSPHLSTSYCQIFAVGKGNAFFPVDWCSAEAQFDQDMERRVLYLLCAGVALFRVLNKSLFCSYHQASELLPGTHEAVWLISVACCLFCHLFPEGKVCESIKFSWPNFSLCISLTCLELVCIFLQWLLCVCTEETGERKVLWISGRA